MASCFWRVRLARVTELYIQPDSLTCSLSSRISFAFGMVAIRRVKKRCGIQRVGHNVMSMDAVFGMQGQSM